MGAVPKPNIVWRGAHPNNFTVGRPGAGRDGRNTNHHVVGSDESAVLVFNQPTRGASSHLIITARQDVAAFQCVGFDDTAWCDGNWESNLRTISMEHHGDWRNGYSNAQVIENSARVVAWLRDQGLVNRAIRHREVSRVATLCPADLPVEAIWNRASEIIRQYNQPVTPPAAEWLRNRQPIGEKTVFTQSPGLFIRNLHDPAQPADSRRFPLNQDFHVKGVTTVGGQKYYITKSSYDTNAANGIAVSEVADTPFVAPVPQPTPTPPKPATPDWADSLLVDEANREMYVLRATPLIDLENGHPFVKDGKEIWFQAGDIVKDISAHTVVSNVTYQLTEFAYQETKKGNYQKFANGIKSSDLTVDASACPPGTPANPAPAPKPADPPGPMPDVPSKPSDADIASLQKQVDTINKFLRDRFVGAP